MFLFFVREEWESTLKHYMYANIHVYKNCVIIQVKSEEKNDYMINIEKQKLIKNKKKFSMHVQIC